MQCFQNRPSGIAIGRLQSSVNLITERGRDSGSDGRGGYDDDKKDEE